MQDLGEVFASVSSMKPEEAADLLRLSRQYKVPVQDVAARPDYYKNGVVDPGDWQDLVARAPKTASFLENPLNMAINQTPERVRQLSDLETVLGTFMIMPTPAHLEGAKDLFRNTVDFFRGVRESGRYNELKKRSDLDQFQPPDNSPGLGVIDNTQYGQAYDGWLFDPSNGVKDEAARELLKKDWLAPVQVKPSPVVGEALGNFMVDVQRQAPQFVAQIALSLGTAGLGSAGSLAAGTAFMGTQIAGGQYAKLEGEGVDPDRAFRAALVDAALQAPLEALSVEGIAKGAFSKWIKAKLPKQAGKAITAETIFLSAASEFLTEWVQQYPEAATEIWARHEGLPAREQFGKLADDFWNITKEGIYQGLVAAPFGAVGGGARVYADRLNERTTRAKLQQLESVVDTVRKMDLLGQSPENIENFIAHISGDDVLFAEPAALNRLFQSGDFSPDQLETMLGVTPDQVAEADQTGEMVSVPLASYVAAVAVHPGIKAALQEHIAFEASEGLTPARIADRNLRDIENAKTADKAMREEARAEADKIAVGILQAGQGSGVNTDSAKRAAALLEKHAWVRWQNGLTESPAQWLRENAPTYIKGTPPAQNDPAVLRDTYKGSIHWQDGKAVISLFEKADPSTLIHETAGHFFIDSLLNEGAREDALDWMKKDRQTVLDFVGLTSWEDATEAQRVEAHEKMAKAAEAYFMTGRAPSIETRSLFRKFREWMLQIYKDMKALGVEIPVEVAEVFDRMLASQSEIEELQRVEEYHNRLPADVLQGLPPEALARYDRALASARQEAEEVLSGRLLDYLTTNAKLAREAERAEAEKEIAFELAESPFYKLVEQIAAEYKTPPKTIAQRYKDTALPMDQEYHFDVTAQDAGYSSGMHLAAEIIERPTLDQAVKAKLEEHMRAWSDLYLDKGKLRETAQEALYSDGGRELLAIEQQILQEKLGRVVDAEQNRREALAAAERARLDAKEILATRPLKDALRVQTYIASERKAAENSARHLAKGDPAEARLWKQKQLLAHAMVQESLNLRRETEKLEKYLKRQAKTDAKVWQSDDTDGGNLKSVSMQHFNQAAEILLRFGFRHKDFMPRIREENLAAYVARMNEENPDMVTVADWLFETDRAAKVRDLTIEELRDVADAIKNIKLMARAGVKADGFVAIHGEGFSGLGEAVALAVDTAEANAKDVQIDRLGGGIDQIGAVPVIGPALTELQALLKKPAQMLLHLDGYKDFGVWDRLFYHHINAAQNVKSRLIASVFDAIEAAYTSEGISKATRQRDAHAKIALPEWNTSVTKNTLRAIALNMGSKSNTERLFSVPPVGLPSGIDWTEQSVRGVIGKYLTEADLRLTQKLWDAINLLYDPYNAMVKRMTGRELPKVEAQPVVFELENGKQVQLQGGYYPLSQDPRESLIAEMRAEQKANEGYVGVMPYPNSGASKARAAKAFYAVDLRLDNMIGHITDVAQDIAFRPVMHDVNKLLRQEAVKEIMRRKLGDSNYTNFEKWIKVIAKGRDAVADNKGGFNRAANWIRQRVVISSLLLRPATVLQNAANPTLYGKAVQEFGEKDAFSSYLTYGWMGTADTPAYIPRALAGSQSAEDLRQFVYSRSAMMRDKLENPDYSLREMHGALKMQNPFMENSQPVIQEVGINLAVTHEKVVDFGSRILAFADQLTDIPMWLGAYNKGIKLGKSEQDAARMADTVIERTTGSGRTMDTAPLQRGAPVERIMAMFMTFMNTQYNRWAMEYNIALKEKDAMRLMSFVATKYLLFGFVSALASFKWPDEDDDPWKWFAKEVLAWPVGMFPVMGSMFKVTLDNALGYRSYGFQLSPAERGLQDILRLVEGVGNDNKSLRENTEMGMQVAAFLFRYPDQINDWLNNAYDIATGETEFQGTDIVRRRPKKDR